MLFALGRRRLRQPFSEFAALVLLSSLQRLARDKDPPPFFVDTEHRELVHPHRLTVLAGSDALSCFSCATLAASPGSRLHLGAYKEKATCEEMSRREQTGVVKRVLADRGFGFIRPDDWGEDVWFHLQGIGNASAAGLCGGDAVVYELAQGRDGRPQGQRVRAAVGAAAGTDGHSSSLLGRRKRAGGEAGQTGHGGRVRGGSSAGLSFAAVLNGEIKNCSSTEELHEIVKGKVDDFNHVNVATALHTMARLTKGTRRTAKPSAHRFTIQALSRRARDTAEAFNPQNVANTLWALATMGEKPERELLGALLRRARDTAEAFKPQELANTLWAFAVFRCIAPLEMPLGEFRIAVDTLFCRATSLACSEQSARGIGFVDSQLCQLHQARTCRRIRSDMMRVPPCSGECTARCAQSAGGVPLCAGVHHVRAARRESPGRPRGGAGAGAGAARDARGALPGGVRACRSGALGASARGGGGGAGGVPRSGRRRGGRGAKDRVRAPPAPSAEGRERAGGLRRCGGGCRYSLDICVEGGAAAGRWAVEVDGARPAGRADPRVPAPAADLGARRRLGRTLALPRQRRGGGRCARADGPHGAMSQSGVRACVRAGRLTHRAAGPRGQVLKRRLLAAAGVVCVSVPFWEWNALTGEASEQWAYLRRKLAEAGAGESAGEMTAAVGHLET